VRDKKFYFIFIFFLAVLDQLTKALIEHFLDPHQSYSVISGFFNITYLKNRGAIFGFLNQSSSSWIHILLTVASFFALIFVVYYFLRASESERTIKLALSLILAGAAGNIIDRIFRGYVVDFIDLYIQKWHWPSFNVADSCISIGAVILILTIIFKRSSICCPS